MPFGFDWLKSRGKDIRGTNANPGRPTTSNNDAVHSKPATIPKNLNAKCKRGLKLLNDLEELREERFQCDFEVRIDEKQFPVHRTVLAASSQYFKAMLKTDMIEANQGYVEMKGLEVKAVKACLDYLYTGEIDFNFEEIEPILEASDMMQIDDLKELSFGYISKNISVDNCLQIRHYATTYTSENATNVTEKFIGDNFAAVAETDQFKLLDKAQLQECFKFFKGSLAVETKNSTEGFIPRIRMHSYEDTEIQRNFFRQLGIPLHENESIKNPTLSHTLTQWQAIVNWVEFDHAQREKHLLGLLESIGPLAISAVFSDILPHRLIECSLACQVFLFKEVVLPKADCIPRYITIKNYFILRNWANRFDSNDVKTTVYNFIVENFRKVVKSERLGELDMEDVRAILTNAGLIKLNEKHKYQAIVRWTREREAERTDHFEELFGLLDLTELTPDFIKSTVRNENLVKSSPVCCEKIMDALHAHATDPSCRIRSYNYNYGGYISDQYSDDDDY